MREILNFLSFAGLTNTSKMVAWLQILKPRIAFVCVQRPAISGGRAPGTGERVGVIVVNLGSEPIECIFSQSVLEAQTLSDCPGDPEAEDLLASLAWAAQPVAIVMKACEGASATDVLQLLGFSTRHATHEVPMMMAEIRG